MSINKEELFLIQKILKTFPGSRILTGEEAEQFSTIDPIKKDIIADSPEPNLGGGAPSPQRGERRQSNEDRHIYQLNKKLVFDGGVE